MKKTEASPIKLSASQFLTPTGEKREFSRGAKFTATECRLIEVMMVEARQKLPWKTDTDFIRWAVLAGLKQMRELLESGRITNLFESLNACMESLKTSESGRRTMEVMEATRTEIRHLESLNAHEQIPFVLRRVKANIDAMQPEYWSVRLKAEFEREYGERLQQGRISLKPKDAEQVDE